jgi:hypothetical protein
MFSNQFTLDTQAPRYLTVDVARFGQDKIVMFVWQGLYVIRAFEYAKKGTDYTEAQIEAHCREYRVPRHQVVVDEDGVGGGVVDHLAGVRGFVNGGKPLEKKPEPGAPVTHNYGNLKSQCYYALSEAVNKNLVGIYSDVPVEMRERIIEDLEQIRQRNPDKDGKLYVTPKEEIKARIGRSSDYGDALMMRMLFEVVKEDPVGTAKFILI